MAGSFASNACRPLGVEPPESAMVIGFVADGVLFARCTISSAAVWHISSMSFTILIRKPSVFTRAVGVEFDMAGIKNTFLDL
jgi:hypothetical protein